LRRDMTGTEVLVEGERRRVIGTISMDALAVELDRQLSPGTPVTLVGDGVLIEDHARVADTIGYEIATGLNTRSGRARRVARDGCARARSSPRRGGGDRRRRQSR